MTTHAGLQMIVCQVLLTMANPVELAHELFGRNGTEAQVIELATRKCIPNYEITEMSLLGNRRLVFQNFCSVLDVDKKMGRFAATVAHPKTFLLRPDLCIGFGAGVLSCVVYRSTYSLLKSRSNC